MKKPTTEIYSDARILFYDIESTGLQADFGTLLAVGYKWAGDKYVYIPAITDYPTFDADPTDDKRLVADFIEVMKTADMVVTYNGKRFDQPYLYAKCLEHKIEIPPNIPHVDLYQTVRHNMKISRKSLQNVGYHLSLSAEKTPVEGRIWKRASAGHRPSIKYIVDHCAADVELLEEAYHRLKPLVRQHPRVGLLAACRYCGSHNLQRRGRYLAVVAGPKVRIRCSDCGGWESRPANRVGFAK